MNKSYQKGFEQAQKQASSKIANKAFLAKLIVKAGSKIKGNPPKAKEIVEELKVIVDLIKSWLNGSYKKVDNMTIASLVAAVIYFVNPFDVIPDFIPILGYIDDASIVAYVFKKLSKEIDDFKNFKIQNQDNA